MKDDRIAALDTDWSEFTEAERTAFAFARQLTRTPHQVADTDIGRLKKHYTDLQILEMIQSIAANNAINRWKDTMGFPQEREASRFLGRGDKASPRAPTPGQVLPVKSFLTPTSEKYQTTTTALGPLTSIKRPALESRADTEKALDECRRRTPRLPLVEEAKARALLPTDYPSGPLPQWLRLAANFPKAGLPRALSTLAADDKGDLKRLLKAQVAWIAARHDRAWYALGHAKKQLRNLGLSDDAIYALDGPWDSYALGERAAFSLTHKVTAMPERITDADVAEVRKHMSDRDATQLIHYLTTVKAYFHRVSEASGLALED